jgi:hypothetical protein
MCCSRSHHDTFHELDAKTYPDNDADYCRCPGSDSGGCCGAISGQDGLCDRCREHCRDDHAQQVAAELTASAT